MNFKNISLFMALVSFSLSLQYQSERQIVTTKPQLPGKHPSKPVIIAIIDTGVDLSHPLLKDHLWINPDKGDDIHGWNFADSSENIEDQHGHGTHIAGIIQQEIERYKSISNRPLREIRFMILKYYDAKSSGAKNLENSNAALGYAIKMGADIANYSGGGRTPHPDEERLVLEALHKNMLIVAAAGNESLNTDKTPFYPASYRLPHVFSVGGMSERQSLAPFSNYGPGSVDILAPGERVLSSLPQKKFGTMTGTSQATAYVTAALAILLASREESLSPAEIREQLFATAHPKSELSLVSRSGGALDTEAFLQARSDLQTAQDYKQANNSFILNEELFDSRPDQQLRLAEILSGPL